MSPLLKSPISEPHEVLNTSSPPSARPYLGALSVWRGRARWRRRDLRYRPTARVGVNRVSAAETRANLIAGPDADWHALG
jgi:hypothetical protein